MKKLKFLLGGQPFRSTDFQLLQDAIIDQFREVLNTMSAEVCILSGVEFDVTQEYSPAEQFTVPTGMIYDMVEVCRVPAATFNFDSAKSLYFRPVEVETSQRIVAGVNQYVMTERMYNLVYATAPQAGDIPYTGMPRLQSVSVQDNTLRKVRDAVSLRAGFTATVGTGLYLFSNGYNERMIVCTFTSTSASGTLCTLDADFRPQLSEMMGWFKSANTVMPLVIKNSGDVDVAGASTSGTNVIMFRYDVGISLTI